MPSSGIRVLQHWHLALVLGSALALALVWVSAFAFAIAVEFAFASAFASASVFEFCISIRIRIGICYQVSSALTSALALALGLALETPPHTQTTCAKLRTTGCTSIGRQLGTTVAVAWTPEGLNRHCSCRAFVSTFEAASALAQVGGLGRGSIA